MLEWELVTLSGMTPRDPEQPPEEASEFVSEELASQRTAKSHRRKRLMRSFWAKTLLFALLFAATVCISVPLLGAYIIEKKVIPRLAARYGVELRLAEAKIRPRRVLLRGLIVRVPGKADPLTAPRAEVRFNLWALLKGRVELLELSLDKPFIQLVRGGDEDNVSQILQRLRSPAGAVSEPSHRSFVSGPQTVSIQSAEVDLRDDAGILHVAGLDATVNRQGLSHLKLHDSVAEIAGGAAVRAEQTVVRWRSEGRFFPASLPEIEIAGGSVVPWRRLAMTGIKGTIRPDASDPARAVIQLSGGYGGVERQLWQASGWVRPDGNRGLDAGLLGQHGAEAAVSVYAQRFLLSSIEPILKDTPIIDADKTEVDASLELRFAQRALDFSGSFHMAGLSVFMPRLVAEPVRELGIDLLARGRLDLKTRRFHLERATVRWNGATAELEAEAEAQPAKASQQPADRPAPENGRAPGGTSWRERWRTVSLHFLVPPISCQALLDSLPSAIVPRIRDFRLAGTFSTDVRVWVDFAKLMKLPPPSEPITPEAQLTAEEEVNELAAILPPAPVAAPKSRGQRMNASMGTAVKDPKDDPVQLSGRVGIEGCKVLEAPKDMNAARLLQSFEHTVLVEGDRELRFMIGPDNPDFVPYEELSPHLINSIMTTEDNGFLRHRGFIVPEFRSALQSNLERGYFRLGASSITMQMVKNILLSREKTLSRKLQEMFLTWYLESNLTSDQEMLKAIVKGISPNQYWLTKLQKEKGVAALAAKNAALLTQAAPVSAVPNSAPQGGGKAPPGPLPAAPALPTPPAGGDAAAPSGIGPVTAAQAYSPLRDISPIKRRILEIYFNAIEFGPYLYGIGKATQHYFGKSPKELTPREAVWFSSILPNPKRRYIHFCKGAPDEKWEKYLDRILRRVHERGRLTDEEFAAAMQQRLVFDRTNALPEKDCLALIQRLTETPPAFPLGPSQPSPQADPKALAKPPSAPPVKLPPPPPWAEADVYTASHHHINPR